MRIRRPTTTARSDNHQHYRHSVVRLRDHISAHICLGSGTQIRIWCLTSTLQNVLPDRFLYTDPFAVGLRHHICAYDDQRNHQHHHHQHHYQYNRHRAVHVQSTIIMIVGDPECERDATLCRGTDICSKHTSRQFESGLTSRPQSDLQREACD